MFIINEHGVIVNPERIEIIAGSYIKLAEWNGRWYYGWDLKFKDSGTSSPVMPNVSNFSSSNKDTVIRHCLLTLKLYKNAKRSTKLIEVINQKLKTKVQQLSLF